MAVLVGTPVVLSTGCATIAHGQTQVVRVTSNPSGARVFVENVQLGVTPAQLELNRRDANIVLRFEKDGFASQQTALKRTLSKWLLGDLAMAFNPLAAQGLDSASQWPLLIAATFAWTAGIDFLSGSAYRLTAAVHAILEPIAGRTNAGGASSPAPHDANVHQVAP
jgi:PEGA domain